MATTIYSLCALTWMVCAFLVLRSWRTTRYRLLLWSGICFGGLAASNVLLVLDKVVFPDIDFAPARVGVALGAMVVLLIGLVFDAR